MNKSHSSENPRRSKRPVLRFVGIFALVMVVSYAITAAPWFRNRVFPAYLQLNARAAAAVLRVFGEEARTVDSTIVSPRYGLVIMRGCDGVDPAILYLAAVIAFPASWRSRTLAAVLGVVAIALLNLVRIVSLYYAGIWFPNAFEFIHVDVWQTLFVFFVVLMWIVWAWRASARWKVPDRSNE